MVNFTANAYKLRCGIEVKRATDIMAELPDTSKTGMMLKMHFFNFRMAKIQAIDQVKAAFKNNYCFDPNKPIHWMLVWALTGHPCSLGHSLNLSSLARGLQDLRPSCL